LGNHVLSGAIERRLGIRRVDSRALPFCGPVRDPAVEAVQARHPKAGLACGVADVDALCRSVLDHRTEFFDDFEFDLGGCSGADRYWRLLAGLLFPQPGCTAAAAGV